MASSYAAERRRSRRFGLALPLDVVRLSNREVRFEGRTRNLSSNGAYFVVTESNVSTGSLIEFIVTLQDARADEERIRLRCRGRVTRSEKISGPGRLGVAATIDRYQFLRGARN